MNILNINPNYDFLDTLALWMHKRNIFCSQGLMIVLPNKNSCKELTRIIQEKDYRNFNGKIVAVSDLDLSDIKYMNKNIEVTTAISKIFSDKENDLKYIFDLIKALKRVTIFKNQEYSTLVTIAKSLKSLFDDLLKSNVDFQDIEMSCENLSSHREFSIEFLKNFYLDFKRSSRQNNIYTKSELLKQRINIISNLIRFHGLDVNLVYAGSTGSVDYMKDFIGSVIGDQRGYFVSSGVHDRNCNISQKDPASLNHDLFDRIGIDISKIENVGFESCKVSPDSRFKFISGVFSNTISDNLFASFDKVASDLDNTISLLSSKNEISQARKVAKIIKSRSLSHKIAIISPDNSSMSLLKEALFQEGVAFCDDESKTLLSTDFFKLYIQILKVIDNQFSSISVLELLKNKLVMDFLSLESVMNFEKSFIRSYRVSKSFIDDLKTIEDQELLKIQSLLLQIYEASLQINELYAHEVFSKILSIAESLMQDWKKIFNEDDTQKIQKIADNLKSLSGNFLLKGELHDFFSQILDFYSINHPSEKKNVKLMTAIESRLINYDLVIITSLNKGYFPKLDKDSWLSGKIKKDLGIISNDKRSALAVIIL